VDDNTNWQARFSSWLKIEGPWIGYVVIAIALSAAVVVGVAFGHIDGKDVVGWAFPLIGTFLGAFLAFRIQEVKDRRAELRGQIEVVNKTLLTLASQYNHLFNYNRNVLIQHEHPMERIISLQATGLGDRFDARIVTEDLVFLAYRGEANLLMELSVEQGRFDSAREVVALRCELMVKEIFPLVEQHGLLGQMITMAQLEAAFGERLFGTLVTATEQVYAHVPSTVESILQASNKLHAAAKRLFPGVQFIKVTPPADAI
jgi:hypothetical protein